ncbi:D-isomer specific 2-hydroxyacid dehydrogenase [Apiospora saccharicola]|uniref:D-isomer specific 2-hydroxyacid dehydrogenase n=1 Tax=Apiospora saccharicola TaxID=335842 RepID=A0ABR1U232_9PEZI
MDGLDQSQPQPQPQPQPPTFWVPLPAAFRFPEGHTHTMTAYPLTDRSQVAERIRDASIVMLSVLQLDAALLSAEVCPHLRMVAVVASGTDSVDLEACRARGIHVANTPHANADSVAEHALALYFAVRRSVVLAHSRAQRGVWTHPTEGPRLLHTLNGPDGKPPRTSAHEVVGIVGYGAVGKKVAKLFKALGMRVLVSGRKGETATATATATANDKEGQEARTPFDTVIRTASVLVLCLPRLPSTESLVGAAELEAMPAHAVLVNVARGGIVDERALPAGPGTGSPLIPGDDSLRDLNLVTTPHVAWCAEDTNRNYNDMTVENIGSWLEGRPTNTVV